MKNEIYFTFSCASKLKYLTLCLLNVYKLPYLFTEVCKWLYKVASTSLILKMVEFNTPFGKNFLNETSENGEMVSNSPEFYYLAAVTSSNVIISVFCLLYLNMKLSLNKFIKGILSIMAIQNIICSSTITISTAVMINLNDKRFWTCQRFVSLHQLMTKSQMRNTEFICFDYCLDSLASSFFQLHQ